MRLAGSRARARNRAYPVTGFWAGNAMSETTQAARGRPASSDCLRRVASGPVERDAPPARSTPLPWCIAQKVALHEELSRSAALTSERLRLVGSHASCLLYRKLACEHERTAARYASGEIGHCPRRCERE